MHVHVILYVLIVIILRLGAVYELVIFHVLFTFMRLCAMYALVTLHVRFSFRGGVRSCVWTGSGDEEETSPNSTQGKHESIPFQR